MAILAKPASSGRYTPAPEGLHQAVCVDVIDVGPVETQYGVKEKVSIGWMLDLVDEESGKPFMVWKRYTNSLHEKAELRKDIEKWLARKLTAKEASNGFDLESLIGKNCQVQIVHNQKEDKVYANVTAIVPLGKGMQAMPVPTDYVRAQDRAETNG